MKRLFSIIISSLFFATSAWAVTAYNINSYAPRLSLPENGVVGDDGKVAVRFYIMAPISKYWVYMDIDESGKFGDKDGECIYEGGAVESDYTYVDVRCPIPSNIEKKGYRWAVKVKGKEDHSDWTVPRVARNYDRTDDYRYSFSKALGVAVDCSYESDYFGYSYVTETHYNRNAWGNAASTKTDGVYIFGPAMGRILNKDANSNLVTYGAYTGNLSQKIKSNVIESGSSFTWGRDDEGSGRHHIEHSPSRLCVDNEGYVYVSENVPATDRDGMVFRMDPANPAAEFKVVLKNSHIQAAAKAVKGSTDGLPDRLQSATVFTYGGKKLLYGIFGFESEQLLTNTVCLCVFDITDLNNVTYISGKYKSLYKFDCTSTKQQHTLINLYNQIIPGANGDVWIFQSREADIEQYPGTIHLDKDLNCDYVIPATTALNVRGSGALSRDGSILVIPSSSTDLTFYKVKYKSGNNSQIESLTKQSYSMTARPETLESGKKHYVDALAFDVANNLYFTVNIGTYPTVSDNKPKGRLYVYALPKTDNSHITPAKSSSKIQVTDRICWHPYPDNYQMTNRDLFEMFKRDYKEWYGKDLLYSVDNGKIDVNNKLENNTEYQPFNTLMRNNSSWIWLGDYMDNCGAQRQKYRDLPTSMDTNGELWKMFRDDYERKFSVSIAVASNGVERTPTNFLYYGHNDKSKDVRDLLNDATYEWGWLKTYLESASGSFKLDDEVKWRYTLAAFFEDGLGAEGKYNAYLTEAKKPVNWGAAYLESTIYDEDIDIEPEWRVCINNFFNVTYEKTTSSNPFIVDYRVKGNPSEWYSEWKKSLPATPSGVSKLPELFREDYVFDGWYFGNKCAEGNPGYNVTARVSKEIIANGCVYARWLETTLHEGYVTDEQMIADHQSQYRNFNLDLINAITNQQYNLKLDRKIVGGMYNTMCLPFAIEGKSTFANIQYVDGGQPFASVDDFSLVYFDGTTPTDDVFVLDFMELGDNDRLPANTPFLLKPKTDITKLMRYGSTPVIQSVYNTGGEMPLSDGDGEDDQVLSGLGYGLTVGDEDEYFTFTGVLAPVSIPANSVLLVADNRLAVDPQGGTMMGMRGFFNMKLAAHNMPMALRITSKEGVTTYLDAVDMSTQSKNATKVLYNGKIYILRDGKVYTITGTRVK